MKRDLKRTIVLSHVDKLNSTKVTKSSTVSTHETFQFSWQPIRIKKGTHTENFGDKAKYLDRIGT